MIISSAPTVDATARGPHLVLLFASTVLALFLRFYGAPLLVHLYIYDLQLCDSDKCLGYGAVYRISFALFCFYLPHALCNWAKAGISLGWCWKLMCFALLLAGSYLLPNTFYDGYVEVARVVSGVFLFLQVVILVDWGYRWNESWLRADRDWKAAVVVSSLLQFAASLTLLIYCWKWFAADGCDLNRFAIIFTLVATFLFTLLASTEMIEHGALLPSAVVTLYCYWVLYLALSSDPSHCNTIQGQAWAGELSTVLGFVFAGFSICYSTWSLASSNSLFGDVEEPDHAASAGGASLSAPAGREDQKKDLLSADTQVPLSSEDPDNDEDNDEQDTPAGSEQVVRLYKFFLVLSASSMYLAMLLTNWGSRQEAEHGNQSGVAYDLSKAAFWIKLVTQWTTIALYTWSLVAPYACPGRDFS
eukprot:g39381.t1